MPVSTATSTTRHTHRHEDRDSGTPLLRLGSNGTAVKRAQQLLKARGYGVDTDGHFGRQTASSVRAFQARHGLEVDGRVGPQTWAALGTRAPDAAGPAGRAGSVEVARGADNFEPESGSRIGSGYQGGRRVGVRLTPVGGGRYLNARAAPSYKAMQEAARRDGVNLPLLSAFRSMEQQQHLYSLYRSGRGNKAARPGYSNHQMGLSVDLGNTGGYGGRNYRWLKQNAHRYGFVNDVRGEPWHWTFKR